jgi:hypothetical protein
MSMNTIVEYQWGIFITIEILSVVSLLLFGVLRYFFGKTKLSLTFIFLFLALLVVEAGLALYIFKETGEISTFQIIVAIFVIYAVTFGINDFVKLDRWMRQKIGSLRGVDLLTERDRRKIAQNKDPMYIAKKYRLTSIIHIIIFIIGQGILWSMGTDSMEEMKMYLTDFSWIEEGNAENSPYSSDLTFTVGMIWGIVFVIDFIYSWSYTVFPSKKK